MDYEQKYKEALCRAKTFYKRWDSIEATDSELVLKEVKAIFPELAESDDERIRKEIIDFLGLPHPQFVGERDHEKWIAWLEKQKDACDREYVFRPLAGDTIEKAAEKAVELDGKVVLAFNGAYIPVGNKTKYEIVAEYRNWVKKQGEQHSPVDIDKMVDKFAHTEVEGYGFPSMIEVDAYRRGIEDAFEKQGGQTQLDYKDEELPKIDLEILFQALPAKIVDEKSHQVYELCVYRYDGQCVVDYVGEIDHDSLYTFGGDTLYDAMEKAWNWLRKDSAGG